jgi:hypothetical protein
MSVSKPRPTGPLVICLTCADDDQEQRISEIEALARKLSGAVVVSSITGRTTALQVTIPETSAPRFSAALALNGATIIGSVPDAADANLLVLITAEPKP